MEKLFGLQMTTIAAVLAACLVTVVLVLGVMGWRNNVILKLGLRPITRRRTQSTLIIVGLMLATLIITAAFVTGDTLSHTIRSLVIDQLGPVDEVVHLRSNGNASPYFSLSKYQDLAEQMAADPMVDGMVPVMHLNLPAVDVTQRQSLRSMEIMGLRPQDLAVVIPEGERTDAEGRALRLETYEGRQVILNQAAAEALAAQPGDKLNLYVGSTPRAFTVAAVASAGRSPRAAMDLYQAQALLGQRGKINAIMVSNQGDQRQGARLSDQVTTRLRGLLTDDFAARRLFHRLADPGAIGALRSAAVTYEGNTRSDLLSLAAGLASGKMDDDVRSLLADEGLGGEVQTILEQADWQSTTLRQRLASEFDNLSEFSVDDWKRDGLDSAELAANAFTTIFVVTGLFGIASGLLLIFLIFVMLAAERKSEMGMTRAIGGQRKHLVQMFVYEGTAYDLGAAAVGVLLGVATGLIIALTLGRAFASTDLAIRPYVTLTSLVVSYSLGMLVTFGTVLFSARRVSHLNIVAAIRDLPEPPPRPISFKDRLLSPVFALVDGFRQLRHLRLVRAVRSWVIGIPKSLFGLVWAGFRGGPLTLLMGLAMLFGGLAAQSGALFSSGVSFALIGSGLVLRWFLSVIFRRHRELTERIAFTLVGLSVTVFWSLPSDAFTFLGVEDLKSGPEMLFIAGFMMVIGAVMVVMYNTDLLLQVILRIFGSNRRLAPVLRMAVAYPLANRFRTGLTLGMFGVVIFSVVFMATLYKVNDAFFANTESLTGGIELRALASQNNPIPNLARSVAAKSQLRNGGYDVVASEFDVPVEVQQEGGKWYGYQVRAVDSAYLDNVGYEIAVKAEGYETSEDVWRMVRDHPGYAVVDSYPVPSRQTTSIVIGGPDFKLDGVYREDDVMAPIRLRVRDSSGTSFDLTVIGVLEQGSMMNFGLIASQATLDKALADPPSPTQYYIHLANGVAPDAAGSALEAAFMEYGLETVDQVQEIKDTQVSQRAIEQLLLGFLTLGLIVGVAALGVISSRAVVERRQQIGVLRALGFQADMVTWSFMVEASFVALLGIGLGAALALIPAYQMISDMASELPGLRFQVPWGSIGLVVGLAYGMALLATYLPARQAASVLPAEALRYE